ncbi:HupE/UreJ family protein [Niabella hibiscisoli]|uniref:HupE/UreJ family protein n=1 Tax=Niabella hibiscisoli TaxID=1825928 RepID=UPI001F0F5872|nr:HupE/UreJ family protein [Niabella hibiscisoli]MCH5716856.1 HupE/UreJ family protein [Niabella hibiscisoli]
MEHENLNIMSDFSFYFVEGWKHIVSTDALDHQLFILALAVVYTFSDWKKVLILVTAFTIGHSLTLALSVLDAIRISSAWVEFLIPVTIVLTAGWNMVNGKPVKNVNTNYFLALLFGLIHGLGFANSIRMMLASDQSLGWGLFGFNAGLEAGQIVVVLIILLLGKVLMEMVKIPQRIYIFVVSLAVCVIAAKMAIERVPF